MRFWLVSRWFLLVGILFLLGWLMEAQGASYYVSKGGDNSAGTSWKTAFTHPDSLNNNMSGGDTAYFGAGDWYQVHFTPPGGNDDNDRTVYACSTYSLATAHTYTTLWSGDSVGDWALHSGSVYKAIWEPSDTASGYLDLEVWQNSPVVVGGDSIYIPMQSLEDVIRSGYFYYDYTNDTLYLWPYIGGDPDTSGHRILASASRAVSLATYTKHVEFWGLGLKMGFFGAITTLTADYDEQLVDSVYFIHCNIAHACNYSTAGQGNNLSLIYSGGHYGDAGWKEGWIIQACTLYSATSSLGQVGASSSGSACTFYGMRNIAFDSCYFKLFAGAGIHWKGGSGVHAGNRVSFCFFDGTDSMPYGQTSFSTYPVEHSCNAYKDSAFGNIFLNIYNSYAIGIAEASCGQAYTQYYMGDFICNNSFYNCKGFIVTNNEAPESADSTFIVKYNVGEGVLESNGYYIRSGTAGPLSDSSYCEVDSNYWYDSEGGSNFIFRDDDISTSYNYNQWQTNFAYDVHGDTVASGFNDPENGDFSRPGASGEMNRIYGGRTWTIFGAEQDDEGEETPNLKFPGRK